jgi:hypothetical protein
MSSEYASSLKKVAFTKDVYNGLVESFERFPGLCEGPATVLRELKGLTHFTLVLSEDGAGLDFSDGEDYEDQGEVNDWDERGFGWEGGHAGDADDASQADDYGNPGPLAQAAASDTGERTPGDEFGDEEESQNALVQLEEEAMETMSKGYFRQVGDIHFESALRNADHWDAWGLYKADLEACWEEEKEQYPNWIRPKASIMVVKYGLCRTDDYSTKVHLLGDHGDAGDDVLEISTDGYDNVGESGDINALISRDRRLPVWASGGAVEP